MLVAIVGTAAMGAYSIYTFAATESNTIMLTLPRCLRALSPSPSCPCSDRIGEPGRIVLPDRPILLVVAIVTAATLLAFE